MEEIQQAIFEALDSNATLTSLLASHHQFSRSAIYGYVPQPADTGDNSLYPLITIGEDTSIDWSTDTSTGFDAEITVHVWSRANGWKEAKKIADAVHDVLHRAELTVTNHSFIGLDFNRQESIRDSDGLTLHIAQVYRLLVEQT